MRYQFSFYGKDGGYAIKSRQTNNFITWDSPSNRIKCTGATFLKDASVFYINRTYDKSVKVLGEPHLLRTSGLDKFERTGAGNSFAFPSQGKWLRAELRGSQSLLS